MKASLEFNLSLCLEMKKFSNSHIKNLLFRWFMITQRISLKNFRFDNNFIIIYIYII